MNEVKGTLETPRKKSMPKYVIISLVKNFKFFYFYS